MPAIPVVLEGVLEGDRLYGLKRLFVKYFKQREPTPPEIDLLFNEVKELIEDARARTGRIIHTSDPSYLPYAKELKEDLKLADFFLLRPAGGSEASILEKAHLIVPRLGELNNALKRHGKPS